MKSFVLCSMVFIFSGCQIFSGGTTTAPKVTLYSSISQCERNKTAEELIAWEYVFLKRKEPESIMFQQNITQDCCSQYKVTLEQEGTTLRIREHDFGLTCGVVGAVEVGGVLEGLDPSLHYTIEVWKNTRRIHQETL